MFGVSKDQFDNIVWEEAIMVSISKEEVQKYGATLAMRKTIEQCSLGEYCDNSFIKIIISRGEYKNAHTS